MKGIDDALEDMRNVGGDLVRSHWPSYFAGSIWILAILAITISVSDVRGSVDLINELVSTAPNIVIPTWVATLFALLMTLAVPLAVGVGVSGLRRHASAIAWDLMIRPMAMDTSASLTFTDKILNRFACVSPADQAMATQAAVALSEQCDYLKPNQTGGALYEPTVAETFVMWKREAQVRRLSQELAKDLTEHDVALPAILLLAALVMRAGFGASQPTALVVTLIAGFIYLPYWLKRAHVLWIEYILQIRTMVLLESSESNRRSNLARPLTPE